MADGFARIVICAACLPVSAALVGACTAPSTDQRAATPEKTMPASQSSVTASSHAPVAPVMEGSSAPDDYYVPDGPRDSANWNGYGDAAFGIDEAAFRKIWSAELKGVNGEDNACYHLSPQWTKVPAELAFMFGDGKFVRYSTESAVLIAPGGGRKGMGADQIEALYPGKITREPHKYTDGQHLRIVNGANVLIFETDAVGKVTEWRVGAPPQIDYVEGCS